MEELKRAVLIGVIVKNSEGESEKSLEGRILMKLSLLAKDAACFLASLDEEEFAHLYVLMKAYSHYEVVKTRKEVSR